MFAGIIVFLALCAIVTYYMGKSRAASVASGHSSALHSRPAYHGGYMAILSVVPAFVLLIIWSVAIQPVMDSQVLSSYADAVAQMNGPQQEAFIRDARALAFDNIPTADEVKQAAAATFTSLQGTYDLVIAVLCVILAFAGAYFASRNIAIRFRARHFVERSVMVFLIMCSAVAIFTTIGIVLSLIFESIRFFSMVPLWDFLFGMHWSPQRAFEGAGGGGSAANPDAFGAVPLFAGTLLITFIAMLIAAPVGLLSAIFLSDYATNSFRAVAKPVLEILAGIPTVVYGFFAALTVAPFFRDSGGVMGLTISSESALAAGVVMGIMIIPFVSSLSDDVINSVPQTLRDGSAALGSTKSETIRKVVLPAALPGIVSALLLAVSRAIGETMIVVMAAGLAANLTLNPFEAVTTVTVQIVTLLTGDQEFDSAKTLAAFALGLVLFCITLCLNVIALRVVQKYREQYD